MGIKNSIIVALKQLCDSQKKPDASREKETGLKRNKTRDGNLLLTGTLTTGLQTMYSGFLDTMN